MSNELIELKKWIEDQQEICRKGYVKATDEDEKIMYSSENTTFGVVLLKINKILSQSPNL